MSTVDLEHPPEGVVVLHEPDGSRERLGPKEWVEVLRRRGVRHTLDRPVAEYLAEARDLGEC